MDTTSTPPPPPPKPTSRTATPQAPPTPTKPQYPNSSAPTPTTGASSSTAPPSLAPPNEPFIPPHLRNYAVADLQYLSHSPSLLTSLFTLHHPTSHQSTHLLTTALNSNLSTAQRLSALESQLHSLRHSTQQKLVATRELEKVWRAKEKEMYAELKRFSELEVAKRLRDDVDREEADGGRWETGLLEGEWEGRGLDEWIKGYREKRKEVGLGRERVGRWGEGRVGGWR